MKSILLFIFSLFSFLGFTQKLVIVDEEDNSPLEMVNIVGTKTNIVLTTNAKGVVYIDSLKEDNLIVIQLFGYENISTSYLTLAEKNKPIVLKVSPFNLNPVVISANRWEQRKNTSPSKISTIDRRKIQFDSPQTAADLLAKNGEVFIQKSQQGGGSPIIRGFSANRLLYTVDGVRMNTAIFRSGNLQNVISLDAFATEKVEVLFGPGSILYGSDAIGGVMGFYTKEPKLSVDSFTVNGNASVRFSSANSELTSHLDLSLQNKKWGVLSSYSSSRFGDLRMGKNGPSSYLRDSIVIRSNNEDIVAKNEDQLLQIPTGYSQQNFMQKIVFRPNKKWSLKYALHYSETSNVDRYDRLIEKRDGNFRFAEWYYGPQVWVMNHINVQFQEKKKYFDKVNLNAAIQRFNESRNDRRFNNSLLRSRKETVDAYSLNLDFYKKINAQHQLFYGIESVVNTVESRGVEQNIITEERAVAQSRYPESTWFSSAIYVKNQYKISEKLILEGGLRVNDFGLNSTFDTNFVSLPFTEVSFNRVAVNASVGGVYKLRKNAEFRTNLSSGYRSPNVDDIGKFFESEPGAIVIPNNNLNEEYAYNFDVGFSSVLWDKLKFDITAFYTFLDDALVRRNFQLNGNDSLFFEGENLRVQAIQNAANAYVVGFYVGLEYKITNLLTLSSRFNYQKGEEELSNGLNTSSRHVAPAFGLINLDYRRKKLRVQANLLASGSISNSNLNIGEQAKTHLYALDSSDRPYSPSWYSVNVKSQYSISDNFSFSIGLENITNQRYRTYSSGISSAGRNLTLSANASF